MAVVLVVMCAKCPAEFRSERAMSEGSARARAAAHGWVLVSVPGRVLDVCPACTQRALPASQRAASAVVAGQVLTASEAAAGPAVVHAAVLVEDDVAMCAWCEAGDCSWCTGDDCGCTSVRHLRVPAVV